jgi:hypothetical protein
MADGLAIFHLDGPVTVLPILAVWQPFNSIDTTSWYHRFLSIKHAFVKVAGTYG